MWISDLVCLPLVLHALNRNIQFYLSVLGLGLCAENKLPKAIPVLIGPFPNSCSSFEFSNHLDGRNPEVITEKL